MQGGEEKRESQKDLNSCYVSNLPGDVTQFQLRQLFADVKCASTFNFARSYSEIWKIYKAAIWLNNLFLYIAKNNGLPTRSLIRVPQREVLEIFC